MNFTSIISILNNFSLLYAVLGFILAFFGKFNQNNFYLLVCLITFAIVILRDKIGSKAVVLSVILLAQMATAKHNFDYVFVILVLGFCIYYVVAERDKTTYDFLVDNFKRSCGVMFAVLCIALVFFKIRILEVYSGRYIFIYFISSIILLRNARYIKYGDNSAKIKKINIRYSIVLIVVSTVFSLTFVREKLMLILNNMYNALVDLFFHLFSWLFYGVAWLFYGVSFILTKLIEFINKHRHPTNYILRTKQFRSNKIPQMSKVSKMSKKIIELPDTLRNNTTFSISLKIAIVLLIIFIIARHMRNKKLKISYEEEFVESKETISNEHNSRRSSITDYLKELTKIRTDKDSIRHYYRKFLRLCIKKNVSINVSDTSKDVNIKSYDKFSKDDNQNLRKIYLKCRYSEYVVKNEDVIKMKQLYENMKK